MPVGKQLSDNNPSGTGLGQSVSDFVGFFGVTAIVQPTSGSQAAVSTAAISAVVTTGAATTSYGFTAAQADSIVSKLNLLITRVADCTTLTNQMRSDLVALGLLKGS